MKKFAVVSCLLLAAATPGLAQDPGFADVVNVLRSILLGQSDMATESTQWLNKISLAAQVANSTLQLATARSQLTTEQQTLAELLRMGTLLRAVRFGNALGDMQQIAALAQAGQGVAFSLANLDGQFRATYPGYAPPGAPFPVRYQQWAQTAIDTIRGTLRAAGTSWQQIPGEQAMIQNYQNQATAVTAQQEALMIQNEVGAEALNQLNKLREIMLTDIQSKQAFEAYRVQKDIDARMSDDAFFAPGVVGYDGIRW